jgi:hypothetical protein
MVMSTGLLEISTAYDKLFSITKACKQDEQSGLLNCALQIGRKIANAK